MTGQHHNWSLPELLEEHAESIIRTKKLKDTIGERLLEACQVKKGRVYQIKPDARHPEFSNIKQYGGRWIYVKYIEPFYIQYGNAWCVKISGPLKRPTPSKTKNGYFKGIFTSNCYAQIRSEDIDLSTECDPPEGGE